MSLMTSTKHARLEAVQAQFDQWRQNRDKRGAIPKYLWAAAASLYPEHSLTRIARTLRLNYTELKNCVTAPSPETSMTDAEHFINLGIAMPACQCTIEMLHSNGNRMRVQGIDSRDLMNLSRLFFSWP